MSTPSNMRHDRGARVLVVDHDELSRFVIARRVQRCGYVSVAFANAAAALDYMRGHTVAAVVSDAHLPDYQAITLAQRVAEMSDGIPVLWMSSRKDHEDLQLVAANIGVRRIIRKQAGDDRELRDALAAVLTAGSDPPPVPRLSVSDLEFAHSLRTPLTALKTAVDLLCRYELAEPQRHFAGVAHRNVERMIALVEQLLRSPSAIP
jgi:CheY-like chemotaxis protein